MNNKDMEQKLLKAVKNSTPDVLNRVLSDCKKEKGQVILMTKAKKKTNWLSVISGIAAALVLISAAVYGFTNYNRADITVDSVISLDVNPSIEINVNRYDEVLSVNPTNKDGEIIVGSMDFTGSKLDVTVNALVGSMLRNGYLTELANSILVSVENEDPVRAAELQEKLSKDISNLLKTDTFNGAVLSQTVEKNDELEQLAKANGITEGKAKLIKQIIESDSLSTYTFEELAPLSINELNLLKNKKSVATDVQSTVSSAGKASDKAYIGSEKAKETAFNHAGVKSADVRDLEVELDFDDGRMIYEVDFSANGTEYEYDINAVDGSVVKVEKDRDDDYRDNGKAQTGNSNAVSSEPAASSKPAATSLVTREQAKEIAFKHAGISAADVRDLEIEKDNDNGVEHYEIEFKVNSAEYDYEINAKSGSIIKYYKEIDD